MSAVGEGGSGLLVAAGAWVGIRVGDADIGVADRVGSIEKGKDADILILSGEPLSVTTRIEKVILNGKTVYAAD